MTLRPRRLVGILICMLLCARLCVGLTPSGIPPATYDYRAQRQERPVRLRAPPVAAPAPQRPPPPTAQTYASDGHALKVWLAQPPGAGPHPVVLYLHGGAALEADEWRAAQAFVDAGYAVVAPTWRGESGNPGRYALCYGEVDDAIAAVRWAAAQPTLDARRMFSFGYQTGGVISALLSLYGELPLVATASVSAMYGADDLDALGLPLPFEDTPLARELRTFPPFVGQPAHPHIAYLGGRDPLIAPHEARLQAATERGQLRVNLLWLSADHRGALEPAISAFIAQIGD